MVIACRLASEKIAEPHSGHRRIMRGMPQEAHRDRQLSLSW